MLIHILKSTHRLINLSLGVSVGEICKLDTILSLSVKNTRLSGKNSTKSACVIEYKQYHLNKSPMGLTLRLVASFYLNYCKGRFSGKKVSNAQKDLTTRL